MGEGAGCGRIMGGCPAAGRCWQCRAQCLGHAAFYALLEGLRVAGVAGACVGGWGDGGAERACSTPRPGSQGDAAPALQPTGAAPPLPPLPTCGPLQPQQQAARGRHASSLGPSCTGRQAPPSPAPIPTAPPPHTQPGCMGCMGCTMAEPLTIPPAPLGRAPIVQLHGGDGGAQRALPSKPQLAWRCNLWPLPTHTAPQPTCGPLGRAPIVQLHSGDEGAERALREGRDDQAWRVAKVLQAVVQVAVAAADNDLQEQEQDKGGRRCVTSLRESCC